MYMETDAVSVRILDIPFHVDRPFDYLCPPSLDLSRGTLVRVPFGRGDRPVWAVVTATGVTPDPAHSLKSVLSALPSRFSLDEEMMGLSLFLAGHCLCSVGDAVRAVLPPALLSSHLNIKVKKYYSLAVTDEEAEALLSGKRLRSAVQRAVMNALRTGEKSGEELMETLSATAAQLRILRERGWVQVREAEEIRNPYASYAAHRDTSPIALSRAQNEVYERLMAIYETHQPKAALLFGVTGSGKTKVMLHAIDRVIADGKTVIMMVPEIALTPQTVGIFCARYGERVAVVHSSLSSGERFDAWRRCADGQVDLVIGTRSAVFAPLPHIGMIVIDEEHEHTYKSDADPKFHTRDVAAYRCRCHGATMLLASATPSFESFYKAKRGDYTLLSLRERYGGATLPETRVIDMREELRAGNTSPVSRSLHEALLQVKERGEQAILFLNRRGYNASLQCKNCGEVLTCPHCSIALTYHTAGGPRLLCHSCGYRAAPPRVCPACGADKIAYIGFGTQKIETELAASLEGMRIMRMDADTTTARTAYENMLDAFRRGEADVLLGTQMVAKGHDFPRVTLVGVLLADMGLYVNDFRASERTFSLLTQVIGRAGRASARGVAYIQTMSPQNEVIRYAMTQDYERFYDSEIRLRESLTFPPFCDMVQCTLASPDEGKVIEAASDIAGRVKTLSEKEFSDVPLYMFGPLEAQTYKVAEQYRMRLLFKCRLNGRTREFFRRILCEAGAYRAVTATLDCNPIHG